MTRPCRFAVTALLASLVLQSPPASACTCMAFPEDPEQAVDQALGHADAVFLGTAEKRKSVRGGVLHARDFTFRVTVRWRGASADIAVVRSAAGSIACGQEFRMGRDYLVFAHLNEDDVLWTSMCELNTPAQKAEGLIEVLDRLEGRDASTP